MDPYSRRFTWNVIRQHREGRVIVLTTHFMVCVRACLCVYVRMYEHRYINTVCLHNTIAFMLVMLYIGRGRPPRRSHSYNGRWQAQMLRLLTLP